METTKNKMTVEVWSDIMCPFCYIGKRKFENALEQFHEKGNVDVVWKSFQLQPDLVTDTSIDIHTYLSRIKGLEITKAKQLNERLTQSAKQVGLEYNFDKAVVANTLKAHILLHVARKQDKQNDAKESLLKAYFTEGKNIDHIPTLVEIGKDLGLNTDKLTQVFTDETVIDEVREDIYEAQQLGIRVVPFFVFDRKFGVSGAQESPVFSQALDKAFAAWRDNNPGLPLEVKQGENCPVDGDC